MLLNMIYTDWKLCTLDPNASDKEKIELLVSLAKTLTLRETLESMIAEYENKTSTIHVESVEIFLYHEIEHKNVLGLLTAIDNMHYSQMGKASNVVNEEILLKTVNEKYMDTLANQEVLHNILQKYPGYAREKAAIDREADEALDKIDPSNYSKEGDYKIAMEAIRDKKESDLRALDGCLQQPSSQGKKSQKGFNVPLFIVSARVCASSFVFVIALQGDHIKVLKVR